MLSSHLPESFLNSLRENFPNEWEELVKALDSPAPVSIRLNPFKNHPVFDESKKVPWTKNAYYLDERPAFYADPYFHAGAYYVQEASSMIVELILNKLEFEKDSLCALDLCAAPGGKSTILSTFLEGRGTLISNELVWKRNLVLQENLERWGQSNIVITHSSSADFRKLTGVFDFALIDAPCSGEGMFRKDNAVINEWSPANVLSCSERQADILRDINGSIKQGGYLIYSTCTYNKSENENLIDDFLERNDFECLKMEGLEQYGIVESHGKKSIFYRLFPHKVKGEGLSICVLRKIGLNTGRSASKKPKYPQNIRVEQTERFDEFVDVTKSGQIINREGEVFVHNGNNISEMLRWLPSLKVIKYGTHTGEFIKSKLVPSHGLALSNLINGDIPAQELERSDALRVLQKDNSGLNPSQSKSNWQRLNFDGNTIALAKVLPNRLNIHLPKTFRIRKNIDEFLH